MKETKQKQKKKANTEQKKSSLGKTKNKQEKALNLSNLKNVNWFGLAGGILLAVVIYLSFSNPWWLFQVGDFVSANVTPFNTNFNLLGTTFLIPLLTAINISSLLVLAISASIMIVYSVIPTKSYSKQLLCFAYKKPLYTIISFVVTLVVIAIAVPIIISNFAPEINLTIPIWGSELIQVPAQMLPIEGVTIGIMVSGAFQWTFWLAIAAAALCIVARVYHRQVFKETNTNNKSIIKMVSV